MGARCGGADLVAADAPGPCVVRPEQTEGPYFVDDRLERSDIRIDPRDGSVRPGVPLRLEFRVSGMAAAGCRPLPGALVDLWHCDAAGAYSDVRDARSDTRGQKFLRGHQVTSAAGRAQFTTIYPGWYSGRAVHVHFKIRVDPAGARGSELTSQLYFDEAVTDEVHAREPYRRRGARDTRNSDDGPYRSGGSRLLLPMVAEGAGYAAVFDVALQA